MKFIYKVSIVVFMLSLFSAEVFASSAQDQLSQYMKSGDSQNVEGLEDILHKEFVSTYTSPGNGKVKTLERSKFIKMFDKGKFGGKPRVLSVGSVTESKNLALIQGEMRGEKLNFSGVFIMQRQGGKWKLKQEYLIVTSS
ncbi:MAG: nuclear transport factor 2 family protein [Arenicella sp.]